MCFREPLYFMHSMRRRKNGFKWKKREWVLLLGAEMG